MADPGTAQQTDGPPVAPASDQAEDPLIPPPMPGQQELAPQDGAPAGEPISAPPDQP